jgi:CD109 antigen
MSGSYKLTISCGKEYSETNSLNYISKEFSLFVQTNKAIYLPGDLIQFRVFAINSESRSVNPSGHNSVTIRDAKGNVISTFDNVTFAKGKYENQLQLASRPSLGLWKIQVQCDDIVSFKFSKN